MNTLFYRKIYQTLEAWKAESAGSTALLVEGARRIGKSTIVEAFAENEYKSHLLIDFSKAPALVKDAFERYINDPDTLFMLLTTEYGVTLFPRESVVIFDEVQFCPKARQAVKHLVADGRYDYLETGSLVSIRENVSDILIPSEEETVKMYPMDFEEFANALGQEQMIAYIRNCFEKKQAPEDALHHKAMLLFKQYMIVGGMPQSVAAFLNSGRKFETADVQKRRILKLYEQDIAKADTRYRSKVMSVFRQIPSFLSHHEKRVRLSHLGVNAQYPAYEDTFFWLADAMTVNECFNCQDPNVGLSINEDRTFVKCYMNDTGLLLSHAFSKKEIEKEGLYKRILHDDLAINEGMFFENAIAQMLVSNGYDLFFYSHYSEEKHRNDIEIDFIVSNGSKTKPKIFPIEVKSSKRYMIKSLERFREKFSRRIGTSYVIHTKNLREDNGILYLPVYMTFCL